MRQKPQRCLISDRVLKEEGQLDWIAAKTMPQKRRPLGHLTE